jgi:hypothetical protein
VYAIKKMDHKTSKIVGIVIRLQDLTYQSLSEQKTGEVCRAFIEDFGEPLAEILLAIHTMTQEKIGPLTEKQKEILFATRDRCTEMERLYKDFRKVGSVI